MYVECIEVHSCLFPIDNPCLSNYKEIVCWCVLVWEGCR